MTISSTTRKAGPFTGNGTANTFPFAFKVFATSDVYVEKTATATGAASVLVLGTDYTVSLNADQNASPGGNVVLTAGNLATGYTLALTSDVPQLQQTDFTNQGGFYPAVLNQSLDRLTILNQQTQEQVDRSIKAPLGESSIGGLPALADRAGKAFVWDSSGNPSTAATPASVQGALDEATAQREISEAMAALAQQWAVLLVSPVDGTDYSAKYNALLAAASATAAGLASTTALAAARIFASTAAGIAGTTNGQYFYVVSASSSTTLELWLNNAGVAADTGKRFPSLSLVQTMVNQFLSDTALNAALIAWTDVSGNVLGYFDQQGKLFLGADTTGLQAQITDARRRAYAAAVKSMRLLASTSSLQTTSIYECSKSADQNMSESNALVYQPLILEDHVAGEAYRIPSLVRTGTNSVLLICENTHIPNITTDVQNSRLVALNLTFDPVSRTLTTSNQRAIATYRSITTGGSVGATAFAANPTPLRVKYGTNAGRIYVFFTTNKDNANIDNITPTKAMMTYSDDNGSTWSTPAQIVAFDNAASGVGEFWCFASGPAGIQLQHGANAGRLVVPGYIYTNGGFGRFACGYSDDGGATWTVGSRATIGSTETSIAEGVDGTIYATSRRESGVRLRDLSKSTDSGLTWTTVSLGYLADANCNGCLFQAASTEFTGPKFFTSNGIDGAIRGNLHLRVSYGPPSTFDADVQIDGTFAGYSAIEMLNEQDGILVYENDENYVDSAGTFTAGTATLHSISAVVFNVKALGL